MESEHEQQLNAAIDDGATEPQRCITVRLPKSLHESLKDAAADRRKSLNQHCIDLLVKLKP